MLTTTSSLKDLLPGAGGQVLNPGSVGDESETGGAPKASTTMAWTQNSVPAFMQTLTPQESQTLINRLQGEPRSNLIAAPKITMFDGQSASINCTRLRPFVTGLRTHDNGELWPEVSEIPEGVKLQMRSELAEDSKTTQLNVRYELSQIVDVEVLHLQTSGPQRSVQIPHVTRSLVNAVATIPWGHSLLIAPLRRDSMGQIHMCLIRPEMVD